MDINKEPIKSMCPALSESWDLEGTKEAANRVVWVEPQEPREDWSGGSSGLQQRSGGIRHGSGEEGFELDTEEELETWSELRERADVLAAGISI